MEVRLHRQFFREAEHALVEHHHCADQRDEAQFAPRLLPSCKTTVHISLSRRRKKALETAMAASILFRGNNLF
jgi:hypothetical protein